MVSASLNIIIRVVCIKRKLTHFKKLPELNVNCFPSWDLEFLSCKSNKSTFSNGYKMGKGVGLLLGLVYWSSNAELIIPI